MTSINKVSSMKIRGNAFTKVVMQMMAPAGEAVTIADEDGYIIDANPAAERVYRKPMRELIGRHPLIFCPDTPEWVQLSNRVFETLSGEGVWNGVVVNKDLDGGSEFPVLLRARKVAYRKMNYIVSWARPFPVGAPFGLTPQEGACFGLLGQGFSTKEVARRMPLQTGSGTVSQSTVTTNMKRIWKKSGRPNRDFSTAAIEELAIRCHEAGWDSTMRLNAKIP